MGRRVGGIEWKVIRIRDDAIEQMQDAELVPSGEIGELVVRGPVVTSRYVNLPEQRAKSEFHCFYHIHGNQQL